MGRWASAAFLRRRTKAAVLPVVALLKGDADVDVKSRVDGRGGGSKSGTTRTSNEKTTAQDQPFSAFRNFSDKRFRSVATFQHPPPTVDLFSMCGPEQVTICRSCATGRTWNLQPPQLGLGRKRATLTYPCFLPSSAIKKDGVPFRADLTNSQKGAMKTRDVTHLHAGVRTAESQFFTWASKLPRVRPVRLPRLHITKNAVSKQHGGGGGGRGKEKK